MLGRIIKYLSQEGPSAPKHSSWKHPAIVLLSHYIFATSILVVCHDSYIKYLESENISYNHSTGGNSNTERPFNGQIANFFLSYFILLLSYRILQNNGNHIMQKACFYEHTFLCNMTLFMGCFGISTGRELLVMSHLVTVSIDQVLWYVDVTGWILSGKFPIGVAKYITWPETSFATRITCTHHLWTIPVLMYACRGIDIVAYPFSALVMCVNVLLSRWMTPSAIEYHHAITETHKSGDGDSDEKAKKERKKKYLNVNLSHELWKDITFDCLQIQHDNPSAGLYLIRLLWRWQVFNGIVFFFVLRPLSLCFF